MVSRLPTRAASPAHSIDTIEHLVDSTATAIYRPGNSSGACPLPVQLDDLCMIQCDRAAFVDAACLSGVDADALAFPDEADLHFGDHAENREHHLPDRPLGRDGRLQHSKVSTLALKLVDEVQNVARAAPEAV